MMISPNFIQKFRRTPRNLEIIVRLKQWYKDKGCKVRLRGRHSDRVGLYRRMGWPYTSQMEIPVAHAEEIAFYAYVKGGREAPPRAPVFQDLGNMNWKDYYGDLK